MTSDPSPDPRSIDHAIADARAGRITVEAMLDALLLADLVVPSGAEVAADGSGFQPVLFDKQGTPMVAVLTSRERIGDIAEIAPYALVLPARDFLARIPAGHGVVINPGQDKGFDMDPEGLRRLLACS